MKKLTRDQVIESLKAGTLSESAGAVELKRSWDKHHGKDISALANHAPFEGGWLIVGVEDSGKLAGHEAKWLKQTEEVISQQINQFLGPSWAVHKVEGLKFKEGCCILIDIVNPGEIVEWGGTPYKLSGTTSAKMTSDESLAVTLQLPGDDYSRNPHTLAPGEINSELVISYAERMKKSGADDFIEDITRFSAEDILKRLNIFGTQTAQILFGNCPFRVAHFDESGDILDQKEKMGLYSILRDEFIEQIQEWTRRQGTVVSGSTASVTEERPYPPKALREVLANAVAHALYQRYNGDIVVEIHPRRLVVQNNCLQEARIFSKQWLSRSGHVRNKLLMRCLRAAKITDEQSTGKLRVYRQMIENGRREPLIQFQDMDRFARWGITLFNEEHNQHVLVLNTRLKELFADQDQQRVALVLVLWSESPWSGVLEKLDGYYQTVANAVVKDSQSPVIVGGETLFVKRWAAAALTGDKDRKLTEEEKKKIFVVLSITAKVNGGVISSEDARAAIGLSDSKSDETQLAHLFRRWAEKGAVVRHGRGAWKFSG